MARGSRSPLIHVGYHKTGTTWLQRFLFDNAAAGYTMPVSADTIFARFVLPNALDFDADRCRQDLCPGISQAMAGGLVAVLSVERLSGNPHSGGYDARGDRRAADDRDSRGEDPDRDPGAGERHRVVLQPVRQGRRHAAARRILDPPRDFRFPQFDFDYFKYHRLVELYIRLLGAERVLVLAYEEFLNEPRTFLAKLQAFAENDVDLDVNRLPIAAKVNLSLEPGVLWLQRGANAIAAERTSIYRHAWSHNAALAGTLRRRFKRPARSCRGRGMTRPPGVRPTSFARKRVIATRTATGGWPIGSICRSPPWVIGCRRAERQTRRSGPRAPRSSVRS